MATADDDSDDSVPPALDSVAAVMEEVDRANLARQEEDGEEDPGRHGTWSQMLRRSEGPL